MHGLVAVGRKVCRFNFAELRSRSFFCFVPLHLPFVYFKVRKRGERKVAGSHMFSSLRLLLSSPRYPMKGTFVLL